MTDRNNLLLYELDDAFRKMIRKFVGERDKVLIHGEVSLPMIVVLGKLLRDGPQKAGELAAETDFSSGATTQLCNRLVQGGYIYRTRPEDDRRTVLLHITEKGRAFMKWLHEQEDHDRFSLFDGFEEAELRDLLAYCGRIVDNMRPFFDSLHGLTERLDGQEGPR
ncbi:MarR family winged helix-turn-helix transcriptional regulator [Paenibacillus methanolicus]|uniref:DNA-binding MarR family transcriptional regulator n=1 Tax=Paenibacillus methanolicus TaxID=582686 RepID=A0A5S5BSR2_9BACL|nr:MarR family transcriptional regulator [Paenibacillus methanolicus]TYP70221.1 DNA-binding MarR family transcriptional regulator [Paenibacillus methanolicus]